MKTFASFVEEAVKDKHMASSTVVTTHRGAPAFENIAAGLWQGTGGTTVQRRRRISPQSGRALEILGHAIEYLADEYVYAGGKFNLADPRIQAVLLLMEKNREIYFACPELPRAFERIRRWFRVSEIA